MWTRKQYMNHECSHDEYYSQFVTPSVIMLVRNTFGAEKLKEAYAQDKYLNNIPLRRWDNLEPILRRHHGMMQSVKSAGDFWSLGNSVCIAKQAARIITEQE